MSAVPYPPRPAADFGTIGRPCPVCKGEYTSTWVGTCTCPGREEECDANIEALQRWRADMEQAR